MPRQLSLVYLVPAAIFAIVKGKLLPTKQNKNVTT
jgi:hypothetical protein